MTQTTGRKRKKATPPRTPKNAPRRRSRGIAGVEILARSHAAAAVAALVAVMEDATASPSARIAAAGALLQWGFGKVPTATRAELLKNVGDGKMPHLIRLSWAEPETETPALNQAAQNPAAAPR